MSARILKLDNSGNPIRWIGLQDAASLYLKDAISWSAGEPELMIQGGINRRTGKQSRLFFSPVIAVKGRNRTSIFHSIPLSNRWLFARDRNLCLYCGNRFESCQLTRDHVYPKGLGGPNTWENCVTACRSCNSRKGCRTPEQAGMKLLAIPYKPNRFEFLALSNRFILADQMTFLERGFSNQQRGI